IEKHSFLLETLRKYPVAPNLIRKATSNYEVPDDDLVIEKGTQVIIPVYSIHMDPKYYPDPNTFNPERFDVKEKAERPNCTYLPFGDGPRICLGKRFAEMEIKLALVEILSKYKAEPCDKTDVPLKFLKKSIFLNPKNGIWLKFKSISA
ncbi:probable cytochrome P450 6a14, partial [Daktulosphaira vitifoliae]|uniref:probable cytochrome P450 6a14 n=1 Tax=Daktulosphaira vitifoliae TaxID=58002 RepID=UPI0021AAC457